MSEITLILLAAGGSTRFGLACKKQWLRIGSDPLWLFVARRFERFFSPENIIVVGEESELDYMKQFASYRFIGGGKERQDSLNNALHLVITPYVLTSDVARSCIDEAVLERLFAARKTFDCVVPVLGMSDTVVSNGEYVDRKCVKLIQTPQLSITEKLRHALKNGLFTDDSGAMDAAGFHVGYVDGAASLHKLTFSSDLAQLSCLSAPDVYTRTGIGFDTHAFEHGKTCVLGGVFIPNEVGFKAHSDGDVLIHSVIDALLGAAGLGDIGDFFPDSDEIYKGIDSTRLLIDVVSRIRNVGFEIVNIDVSVIAERPRLSIFKEEIKRNLAKISDISPDRVCIKATTAEKMGFVGRQEGVAVFSTAALKFFDWTKQ